MLSSLRRSVRHEPFEVAVAGGGEEGLRLLQDLRPAVVVSDMRMPGMNGVEFLEAVRERQPKAIRLVLSAHADFDALLGAINRGAVHRFLTKPWTDGDLRAALAEALALFDLGRENERLRALTDRQNAELAAQNRILEERVAARVREVAGLHDRLATSFLVAARLLTQPVEERIGLVGSHSARVAAWCVRLGRRLGLVGQDLFHLEVAATLHDVGKISLPTEVLAAPEHTLGTDERTLLARHPVLGEAMLRAMPDMLPAAKLVRHHHERYDGLGYPDGLARQDIPLGSRIIAAVDAFDKAMHRRESWAGETVARALLAVRQRPYTALDGEVVDALAAEVAGDADRLDREVDIGLRDLAPGSVLARDLRTEGGVLLLPAGTAITADHLARGLRGFLTHVEKDGIALPVWLRRRAAKP